MPSYRDSSVDAVGNRLGSESAGNFSDVQPVAEIAMPTRQSKAIGAAACFTGGAERFTGAAGRLARAGRIEMRVMGEGDPVGIPIRHLPGAVKFAG